MSDIFSSDVTVEAGSSPLPISGTVTGNQGAPNTLANGWPVEVTDGTNVLGTPTHPLRIDPTGTTTQPISGTVTTSPVVSNTASITQVIAVNATNVQLVAANANRKKIIINFPKGSGTSFLKFGATASATSFTYLISTNNTVIVEMTWTGEIDYNGTAQTITITELT